MNIFFQKSRLPSARIEAQYPDAPHFREQHPGNIPKEGRFAGAIASQQAIDMTGLKIKVEPCKNGLSTIGKVKVPDTDR